jgi:GWxTD domain-containing protein
MSASTSISGKLSVAKSVLPAFLLIAVAGACSTASRKIEQDPFYESFFEKARLIMTKEEIQIYKHLPDTKAREEFIDEFWSKRDPFPETSENENKIEFERRIAYANRWFRENRAPGRGWDTQRGRILIQLGEPDNRFLNEMLNNPNIKGYERWVYIYYRLELIFVDSDGFGEYKLRNYPAELLTAINLAKFTLNMSDREAMKNAFSFDANYRDGQLNVSIPMKKVRFREEADSIHADYKVSVFVYRDYRKIDSPTFSKQFRYDKNSLPGEKKLAFSLPYALKGKGRYYMDVIVEDLLTGAKSRNFISFKL